MRGNGNNTQERRTMKYCCDNCGEVFDEEDSGVIYEWEGEGVMRGERAVGMCCPKCGCEDLWEADECCCCGEEFDRENGMIKVGGYWYCLECAKAIHDAYAEDQEKRKKANEYWEKRRNDIRRVKEGK